MDQKHTEHLIAAIEAGDEAALTGLLASSWEGSPPLAAYLACARRGHVPLAERLFASEAHTGGNIWNDAGDGGWRQVHEAARHGQAEYLRFLAAQGANLDAAFELYDGHYQDQRGTALTEALLAGHIDCALALLEAGADGDANWYESEESGPLSHNESGSALTLALESGEPRLLEALASRWVQVDRPFDDRGTTALALALQHRRADWLAWLLAHGANPEQAVEHPDNSALPPLVYALYAHADGQPGALPMAELLLRAGSRFDLFLEGEDKSLMEWVFDSERPELLALFGLNALRRRERPPTPPRIPDFLRPLSAPAEDERLIDFLARALASRLGGVQTERTADVLQLQVAEGRPEAVSLVLTPLHAEILIPHTEWRGPHTPECAFEAYRVIALPTRRPSEAEGMALLAALEEELHRASAEASSRYAPCQACGVPTHRDELGGDGQCYACLEQRGVVY
ncbi:MAG: ankyrin repeat domain-containing protein [Gammaproteobacteria bacterium]|nr:ankyrin repeat domain-containing protein [Gammaproteobacteria bacterium]